MGVAEADAAPRTLTEARWALDHILKSTTALVELGANSEPLAVLMTMALHLERVFRSEGKLLICGCGGSAAEAQHMAAEFVVKMSAWRRGLPAIALTADGAVMTAAANDAGLESVFARQVAALGSPGDVLLAISTSGMSIPVLAALDEAATRNMTCFGFSGRSGGDMARRCGAIFRAPSDDTAVVQQLHGVATHVLCGLVERAFQS